MEMEPISCQFCSTNLNEADNKENLEKYDEETKNSQDDIDLQVNEEDIIHTQVIEDIEATSKMDSEGGTPQQLNLIDKYVNRQKRQSVNSPASSDIKIKQLEEKLNTTIDRVSQLENQLVDLKKTSGSIHDLLETHLLAKKLNINETNKQREWTKINVEEDSPCTFNWNLTHWEGNMKNAKAFILPRRFSSEFFTSTKGYKMKAWICENGVSNWIGTHVSIALEIIPGDYDDQLNWPFSQKVTFTLLNQNGGTDYSKTFDPAKKNPDDFRQEDCFERPRRGFQSFGFSQFISHKQLDEGQFIKDDTGYFRIQFSN